MLNVVGPHNKNPILFSGNNSCSKNLLVALKFAFSENRKPYHIPTVFVIGCRNFLGIQGMTMNNEAYTAYPSEAEVLLCDGTLMIIMAVDRAVRIDNTAGGMMALFNDQPFTVIHLYHNK